MQRLCALRLHKINEGNAMKVTKAYLGDAVYVVFDGRDIIITTEDDLYGTSNRIVLTPETLQVFDWYRKHFCQRETNTEKENS